MDLKREMKNDGIEKMKPKIVGILKKHGIKRAGIFGSYARGEQKAKSDVDILIEVGNGVTSLLDIVEIKLELEGSIGKSVDLVEYKIVNPRIKKEILLEEVRIL